MLAWMLAGSGRGRMTVLDTTMSKIRQQMEWGNPWVRAVWDTRVRLAVCVRVHACMHACMCVCMPIALSSSVVALCHVDVTVTLITLRIYLLTFLRLYHFSISECSAARIESIHTRTAVKVFGEDAQKRMRCLSLQTRFQSNDKPVRITACGHTSPPPIPVS